MIERKITMAFQNKEQEIEHYTKVFCDMLETMEYSLEKKENGKYCLVDKQSEYLGNKKNYEEIEKGSASAVVDRVSTYLNDYYFNVLQSAASGDFDIDFSQPDVPTTAEDWIKFMDANENFKKEYFHEYEVMKMLSSSEILNAIKLDDVCQYFIFDATHEKGEKENMEEPIKDEEGKHYTKVFCDMLETMEYSLEKQEDGKYCLVDEQGEYFEKTVNRGVFDKDCAGDMIEKLASCLEDYYYGNLEAAAEGVFGIDFSQPDAPTTAEEWVEFMDENEGFKEVYSHEYDIMKLISSPELLKKINLDDVVQHFNPDVNYEKSDKIVIGRPIEGLSLNGLDYLCGEDGKPLQFADEKEAKAFLLNKCGYTEQSIEDEGIIFKNTNLLDVVYSQEDIAQFDETAKQLEAYKKYKEEWIKTNVSETDMIATEAAYENDEEAKDMTFEEYVEEHGFANDMIYYSFEEFLENEYKEFSEKSEHEFDINEYDDPDYYEIQETIYQEMQEQIALEDKVNQNDLARYYEPYTEPLEKRKYGFDMSNTIDVIREMGANEHITLDGYMEDIVVVITKDASYDHNKNTIFMDMDGADAMNLVKVDFKLDGKSIASTYDIHVDNLEGVLNDILEGKGHYLVDEKRTLQEVYQSQKDTPVKVKDEKKRNEGREI